MSRSGAAFVPRGQLVLNFEDFLGTGVTDHTAALASVLATARTQRATVSLGFGKTYTFSGTLNPTGARIFGNDSTLRYAPSATAYTWNLFQANGAFTACDLTIDQNSGNVPAPSNVTTQQIGVYCYSSTGWVGAVRLANLRVINPVGIGVKVGSSNPPARTSGENSGLIDPRDIANTRAIIDNLDAAGTWAAIMTANASGVEARGVVAGGTGSSYGIYDNSSLYATYSNVVVGATSSHGILTQYSRGARISGATVTGSGGIGVCVGGGSTTSAPATHFRIESARVSSTTLSAVSVDTTVSGTSSAVQNTWGTIEGVEAEGSAVHGFYLNNAGNCTITGGIARNNTNTGFAMTGRHITASGVATGNGTGVYLQAASSSDPRGYYTLDIDSHDNTTTDWKADAYGYAATALRRSGIGSPQGAVWGTPGSTYLQTDVPTLWINTGAAAGTTWTAK